MQLSKTKLFVCMTMLLACARAQGQESHQEHKQEHGIRVIEAELPEVPEVSEEEHEHYRLWGRAEGWIGWIRDSRFPTLVTVGSITQPRPGALGADGTLPRFGGRLETHERFGGKFELGCWLDCEQCLGVELGFAFLGSRTIFYEQSSPGFPAIARPFFDVNSQQQDASLVTYPGVSSGGINVTSGTTLYGAYANSILTLNCSHDYPVRMLAGFRYLAFHEDLDIYENSLIDMGAPVYPGQRIAVQDHFQCDNYFYGGNLGLRFGYHLRRLELSATAQCALGLSQQIVRAAGYTQFDGPGAGPPVNAGLLAVSSNSLNELRNVFAVVPEVDLDARFALTKHIHLSGGWSFLYWSRVARVGQQVDTNVNPNLVPTSSTFGQATLLQQPTLTVNDTGFWVHGLRFGLELRF